jgi:hypothetical protein
MHPFTRSSEGLAALEERMSRVQQFADGLPPAEVEVVARVRGEV